MAKRNKALKALLEEVVEKSNLKEQLGKVAKLKGLEDWIKNIGQIGDISELLALIADAAKEMLKDINEEEIIETIAEFLDDKIKLPFFLEPFDRAAFKLIVSYAWHNVIKKNILQTPKDVELKVAVVSLTRKIIENK